MPAGLTGCLNSLDNFNLAAYTGLDLAAGSAPSAAGAEPSGCSALTKEEGTSTSIPTSADANQIGLGAQPLLLVALVAMLLGSSSVSPASPSAGCWWPLPRRWRSSSSPSSTGR